MKLLIIAIAARLRPTSFKWLLTSIAILVFAFFLTSNPIFAASENKIQCAPHTAVTKNMIVASLSSLPTPIQRVSPTKNSMEKDTVAPRSEWIRVAPLVNTQKW